MVTRIVITGFVIAALMVAVKDGRLPRAAGITGSCRVVQTTPNGARLDECKGGWLGHAPDLSAHGCTNAGTLYGREYWRC
jgi:hypothetical protein